MIPEEHLPAVDRACVDIIHIAYHSHAGVPDFITWIGERLREFYAYEDEK